MIAKLVFEDGQTFEGEAFGHPVSSSGEIVFNTGMVGYAESMTDPSYEGQILVFSYPLIGNYGVPGNEEKDGMILNFESERIHTRAIVVNTLSETYSHWSGVKTLDAWMKEKKIPGLHGIDTRMLIKKIRTQGSMLAKILIEGKDISFYDPNKENLVEKVSITEPQFYEASGDKKIVLMDCGSKHNIVRIFLEKGVSVLRVPWNYDFLQEEFDGIMITNGPGNPNYVTETVELLKKSFEKNKPIFGICLGHQLLSIAAGASIYKLKFGHRSQNQPCIMAGSKRCFITSQNHGFAVDHENIHKDWQPYFFNANDGSNEGIRHKEKPFFSVQFHPEAVPGPSDTEFLFDDFISKL